MADVKGYAGQYFALAVASGLLALRTRPGLHRPFKAWLPAVWLRILLSVCLILAALFPPRPPLTSTSCMLPYAIMGVSM
jgi:hypothetical protein